MSVYPQSPTIPEQLHFPDNTELDIPLSHIILKVRKPKLALRYYCEQSNYVPTDINCVSRWFDPSRCEPTTSLIPLKSIVSYVMVEFYCPQTGEDFTHFYIGKKSMHNA